MFRKLVSNLLYSPSLMGEFGAYARRLKREESARKISVIVTTLAVLCNSFASLSPPSSANMASPNDLISGGVSSKEALLHKYNTNERNFRDIVALLGITRADLEKTTDETAGLQNAAYITGRTSSYSYQAGEREYLFEKQNGDIGAIYLYKTENLGIHKSTAHPAFVAISEKVGTFAILKNSGNVVLYQTPETIDIASTCELNKSLSSTDSLCQPCPGDTSTWVGSPKCATPFVYSKTAANATQRKDTATTAQSSDRIVYKVSARNVSTTPTAVEISDNLTDILEYADIIDTGGGIFDARTSSLTWPEVSVEPSETVSQSFSVRIKPHIPATAQGTSNPTSYDCVISNTYGNTVRINVECPISKYVEHTAQLLPRSPNITSFMAGIVLFFVTLYFYARARQLREEVRLIRKDINTGAI